MGDIGETRLMLQQGCEELRTAPVSSALASIKQTELRSAVKAVETTMDLLKSVGTIFPLFHETMCTISDQTSSAKDRFDVELHGSNRVDSLEIQMGAAEMAGRSQVLVHGVERVLIKDVDTAFGALNIALKALRNYENVHRIVEQQLEAISEIRPQTIQVATEYQQNL